MNPRKVINLAMRRADKAKAIGRFVPIPTKPSARPVWALCIVLVLLFGGLVMNLYVAPVASCERVK